MQDRWKVASTVVERTKTSIDSHRHIMDTFAELMLELSDIAYSFDATKQTKRQNAKCMKQKYI